MQSFRKYISAFVRIPSGIFSGGGGNGRYPIVLVLLFCCRIALGQESVILYIEISGVKIRTGITEEEVRRELKDREISRYENKLTVTTPKFDKFTNKTFQVIVGTLNLKDNIVVSACKDWNAQESTDAELARLVFGAITSGSSEIIAENAIVETSVVRRDDLTMEILVIHVGQKSVTISREERHVAANAFGATYSWATVTECIAEPGWRIEPAR